MKAEFGKVSYEEWYKSLEESGFDDMVKQVDINSYKKYVMTLDTCTVGVTVQGDKVLVEVRRKGGDVLERVFDEHEEVVAVVTTGDEIDMSNTNDSRQRIDLKAFGRTQPSQQVLQRLAAGAPLSKEDEDALDISLKLQDEFWAAHNSDS